MNPRAKVDMLALEHSCDYPRGLSDSDPDSTWKCDECGQRWRWHEVWSRPYVKAWHRVGTPRLRWRWREARRLNGADAP